MVITDPSPNGRDRAEVDRLELEAALRPLARNTAVGVMYFAEDREAIARVILAALVKAAVRGARR